MKYSEFEIALSQPRIEKYLNACGGNKQKAISLYRYNIKLCQRCYGILGFFEVVLRNAINAHFIAQLDDEEWILHQANEGFLDRFKESVNREYQRLLRDGAYAPHKLLTSLTFGAWVYLYSRLGFRTSGQTLLQIFPNKPHGLGQNAVHQALEDIRVCRNRIAHHEPICFDSRGDISAEYVNHIFELVKEYLYYLGFNPDEMLWGIEKPDVTASRLLAIKEAVSIK